MKFIRYLCLILSLFLVNNTFANLNLAPDDQDIAAVFKKNKAKGTMVLTSQNGDTTYIFNQKRANRRLSPASTFKIANSLIALEEGVLKDQFETIKWDGKKRELDAWNKDQNLKSAFKISCVWCYQGLAKKIGKKKYAVWLKRFRYGNHQIGNDVTTFWLIKDGGAVLKITPLEQIGFLKKVYNRQLPSISDKTYDILKDIMLMKSSDSYKVYAKIGAATINWVGHGWYAGYVVSKGKTWFFATNILINDKGDLSKRENITMQVLKKKGII